MPCAFNKLGISFSYPENWTLDEAEALAGRRAVTVYSPGGAFWSVSAHPGSADPTGLAKAAIDAIKDEYTDVEVEEALENVAGHDMVGYDLNFFFLDMTNTATVRCFRAPLATYAVFCQAEDRELDQVRRVFAAITTSLVRGLGQLHHGE